MSDEFKTRESFLKPDIRNGTTYVPKDLEHFFQEMEGAYLIDSVPEEIRNGFNAARNTFLYSYFSNRLAVVARTYGLLVVELAMRTKLMLNQQKAGQDADKKITAKLMKMSFSELFQSCIDNKWINDSIFVDADGRKDEFTECAILKSFWAPSTKERAEYGFMGVRNSLVHNPRTFMLPHTFSEEFSFMAKIINLLFKPE